MDEKQEIPAPRYIVSFGQKFLDQFDNFPPEDQDKILDFSNHVAEWGFDGLPGRNKPSHNVSTDDPCFRDKVRYAMDNNLWHYHIGIPSYDESRARGGIRPAKLLLRQKTTITV